MFKPKLFSTLKGYSKQQLLKDITAGIIVGIIALPLSIALAISSNVSPEKGLYTAIVAGFLISFLGGSRVQIGGPTGAFVVIVYGIISRYGYEGLVISTLMAGIFLILMGLLKLGNLIKFIPAPVITGFTSGIAVVIFSGQIKDFLGLRIDNVPSEFLPKLASYISHISTINYQSVIIGAVSIVIIILWPKINRVIPGSLIAIIVTTIASLMLKLDVETIGSKFGEFSSQLPPFSIPNIDINTISQYIRPAFTIAILAGIESLLSAVVADGMVGDKHCSNTELIAQGTANIASALFGGIPATGAIARTAANVKNGGNSPIAGMVHSLTLLVIMLVFMPYATLIPLSTLAAVLIVVAYNMSEWKAFVNFFKAPKSDITVLLLTFFLTVISDLVIAIEVGMVIAAFLFMKRMADVTNVKSVSDKPEYIPREADSQAVNGKKISKEVMVYEINGPFFFGAAGKFVEVIEKIQQKPPKVMVLKMRNVPAIDATGYSSLYELYKRCRKNNTRLLLSNVQPQPMKVLEKYGFIEKLGRENLCLDFSHDLLKAGQSA
ncbi:SulP family inorganic anion transporter [Acetivibrio straminisolvens]|uniref:Sulfate permease n=1 Tax=Acetivibrio straminisolvens JCM 21531 TaxID=1294263 RepID=W4V1E7_9FIRM|nr:sulfate permease [Acetivibrio straminisolvens]GAE87315.1 sulfate permease [Acetivibrio straminisolvens JCM 21531]